MILRKQGLTQSEIAKKLGYKNHSGVTKKLKSIKAKLEAYLDEIKDN